MSRECCGPDEPRPGTAAQADNHDEHEELAPWWRDRTLLLPAVAGMLLLAGYVSEWSGAGIAATIVLAGALLTGAGTFAPSAIRRLLRGRLGVGLLMTISAVGAVLLGHVGEAAALAFLFSTAEALEDRAMDRARHGLRALLSLIPETARLSSVNGEMTVPATEVRVGASSSSVLGKDSRRTAS